MKPALVSILCLITGILYGQYRFDHLSTIDGLSQNSVNDIFQDSQGFIWFATQEGLNKYDGYEFVKYTMDGEVNMAGNFLWSIVEDSYNNIWTASSSGATRLNWKNGTSTHFLIAKEEQFRGQINQVLRVYNRGDKVMITYGEATYLVDPLDYPDSATVLLNEKHLFKSEINPEGRQFFNSMLFHEQEYLLTGNHLIGTDTLDFPEGYRCSRFKSELFELNGGILIGSNDGLLYYNEGKNLIETIPCLDEAVNEILWGPSHQELWIATDNGIYLFDPEEMSCSGSIKSGDGENDLTSNTVAALMKSKEGLIWAGTANGGINIYDPAKDKFKFLTKENGFSDKAIWSVFLTENHLLAGADNGLYLGSLNGRLTDHLFAEKSINSVEKLQISSLHGKRITAIEQLNENEFLIGTFNEEIIRLNIKTKNWKLRKLDQSDISPHVVSAIKVIENEVWVTTHNGIFLFSKDLELRKFFNYQSDPARFPTNYYLSAYVSKDKTLWIGSNVGFYTISHDKEIQVFSYDKNQPDKGPAFNFVSGFFEDKYGKIWMATFGGGVSCFDRETQKFIHFNRSEGLANEICSAIIGNESEVFVSTNGGISKIDLETYKITNYNTSDGIINNEFAIASTHQLGGDFVFGNVNGLVLFNPADLNNDPLISPPVITKLTSNYKEALQSRIDEKKLEIAPEEKIFSLEFSNMSFRKKDQIVYQYSLTNFNEDWVDAGPFDRRATYSLPPGEYIFNVRAKYATIHSEVQSLAITVHPAFYQTWWFILICSLFGIGLIAAISRYFSHQALKEKLRKLEVQQRIQKERERISRDLHDNVGSQITYIATSIDNLAVDKEAEEIRELGEFTRDTMRQLRETIWVINRDHISIDELRGKIIDYLAEVFKHTPHIKHEVKIPAVDIQLNPEYAINLFRIVQEAVNNAVKHAQPTLIKITLEGSESYTLTISDDGMGFDGNDKAGHFGLINLRSRSQELGGEFSLETGENSGTSIRVSNLKIGQMS